MVMYNQGYTLTASLYSFNVGTNEVTFFLFQQEAGREVFCFL